MIFEESKVVICGSCLNFRKATKVVLVFGLRVSTCTGYCHYYRGNLHNHDTVLLYFSFKLNQIHCY